MSATKVLGRTLVWYGVVGGGLTAGGIHLALSNVAVSPWTVLALGMCSLCVSAILLASGLQGRMTVAAGTADVDDFQEFDRDIPDDSYSPQTVGPTTAGAGVTLSRIGISVYLAVVGVALLYALTTLY